MNNHGDRFRPLRIWVVGTPSKKSFPWLINGGSHEKISILGGFGKVFGHPKLFYLLFNDVFLRRINTVCIAMGFFNKDISLKEVFPLMGAINIQLFCL